MLHIKTNVQEKPNLEAFQGNLMKALERGKKKQKFLCVKSLSLKEFIMKLQVTEKQKLKKQKKNLMKK